MGCSGASAEWNRAVAAGSSVSPFSRSQRRSGTVSRRICPEWGMTLGPSKSFASPERRSVEAGARANRCEGMMSLASYAETT